MAKVIQIHQMHQLVIAVNHHNTEANSILKQEEQDSSRDYSGLLPTYIRWWGK